MRRTLVIVLVAAFVVGAILAWRSFSQPRRQADILLITLDTTRADHIGAYGDARARTPRIDALAREGVLFERAITAAPITLPAHASLLTGLYPFAHGVRNNGTFSLGASVPTLATALHDRGYRTAAFVSAFVLDRRYGLARGFDEYDDRVQLERTGDRTAAAAVQWLGAHVSESTPFFVWLHLYDPHDPYDPPTKFREAFADRLYDGEIAFDDEVVGTVLDALQRLGRRESTLVAVVGDHGESLGEHAEETHAMFVYEATLRVPLILSGSQRLPAGRRVAAPVRTIDLAPTLLDLAGAPPLPNAQGQSLRPLATRAQSVSAAQGGGSRGFLGATWSARVFGGVFSPVSAQSSAAGVPGSAYAETYFPLLYMNWAPLRSIQDERWKFIDAPTAELYDLANDAGERSNLAVRELSRTAAMRAALERLTGGGAGAMAERSVDRDTAQKLAALGYIGAAAGGATRTAADGRPDPKAMIGVFNRLRGANAALQQGRVRDAEMTAREVLEREPKNAFATLILGNALLDEGRYADAIRTYQSYAGLVPTSSEAHHRIAVCYSRMGDVDRAIAEEDAALVLDARDADARMLRGGLLAARGRTDEAIVDLRAAAEIVPDSAPVRVGLARVLISAKRLDEADAELRRALELQPQNPDAHAAQAALLEARGDLAAAAAVFARALQLRPDADDVRLDYASTLEKLGRISEARTEYQRLATGRETPRAIRSEALRRSAGLSGPRAGRP